MSNINFKHFPSLQSYEDSIAKMEQCVANIIENKTPEQIWLLEYKDIITTGTSTKKEDILNQDKLPIYTSSRGGQATYHGPGQRIIYPLLKLEDYNNDIRHFITSLELWVVNTLKDYGIDCFTCPKRVGIWTKKGNKEYKIAAIGLRVRKWVSYHGIAVNINPDLKKFSNIIPCGIKEHGVTSLKDLGINISLEDFDKTLIKNFASIKP